MGYYAASSGNFIGTFRENLSVTSSGFKNHGLLGGEQWLYLSDVSGELSVPFSGLKTQLP
jgi:hypothetical protein